MSVIVESISTDNIMEERHMGWIQYREGDALLRVKVVRGSKRPFLSHVTAYRNGVQCSTVDYPNRGVWRAKEAVLLEAFRNYIGPEAFDKIREEYAAEAARPQRHSL